MKEVKYTKRIPICPTCDVPTVRENRGGTSTCMGYSHSYDKDGNDVSVDPNIHTSTWYCHECIKEFSVKTWMGTVEYAGWQAEDPAGRLILQFNNATLSPT